MVVLKLKFFRPLKRQQYIPHLLQG